MRHIHAFQHLERAAQYVFHEIGAEVADACGLVHRRAAGIHPNTPGYQGRNGLFCFCGCIVERQHDRIITAVLAKYNARPLNAALLLSYLQRRFLVVEEFFQLLHTALEVVQFALKRVVFGFEFFDGVKGGPINGIYGINTK